MPLGRQLAKIFNPGPAQSYNPDREALFAQMLASSSRPTNDVGSAIGNIAQFFVANRGLKKQGKARDIEMEQQAGMEAEQQAQQSEAMARLLSGLNIDVDSAEAGILQQNPNIMSEVMQRTRPQEPEPEAAPKMVKGQDGANYWATGPEAGQRVLPNVEAPEAPAPDRKMLKGADGFNYYTDTGERVLPDVEKPVAAAPAVPKGPDVKGETGLRKEYTSASQDFKARQDGYRTVKSAGARGTAVSDHALIFAYMKTQDPTSVVRESEFEIAQSLGSFTQRIQASAQKVINGERLTPPQRQDLIDTSKEIHMANVDAQRNLRSQYVGIADSYEFDSDRSLIDFIDESLLDDIASPKPGKTLESDPLGLF